MQVKSIAECSKGSILQYFLPSLIYHLSLRSLFCLFWVAALHRFYCSLWTNFSCVSNSVLSFKELILPCTNAFWLQHHRIYGPRRENTCLRKFANNKCANQPAYLCRLISAIVIHYMESIILIWASTRINLSLGICKKQMHRHACASAKTDQHLCYSLYGKYHNYMGLDVSKPVFGGLQTTKAQTSLRICSLISALLFTFPKDATDEISIF